MIEHTVSRYPGDKPGPDIVDPLITSVAGAEERGQGEIDKYMYDRTLVAGKGPLRDDHIEPASLVENLDLEGPVWRGQVERSAIVLTRGQSGFTATISCEIDRVET